MFQKEIKKKASSIDEAFYKKNGCILLFSHQVSLALPSPQADLTAEFGMGSGISPPLSTHPN